MRTEIYIENSRLDIAKDEGALLTFAIDDIKDFSARSTAWSKTIILPGTANNNKLFGNIFQAGQSNEFDPNLQNIGYNFNASKSAACIIFQDNIQTFKGVLRILEITIDGGRIEYQVSVFGELFALNAQLSGLLLENLDFSAYNHTLSITNIVSSWDNASGAGYYYPLIDHGNYSVNKHDWDYHTFRPALYARQYLDKMISNAGFRYTCDLFDTARFKKLIIPYNQKVLTRLTSSGSALSSASVPSRLSASPDDLKWATITGSGFTFNTDRNVFTYVGTTANVDISLGVNGEFSSHGSGNSGVLKAFKNGVLIASQSTTAFSFFGPSLFVSVSINPGDTLNYQFVSFQSFSLTSGQAIVTTSAGSVSQIPVNIGDPVVMNETIPKNIRQIDFLVSIVKLFNLYVYEDKFDSKHIFIKPYVDFYVTNNTDALDWTYKLNRDKNISLKPMSEINAKVYKFQYKSDSDYYNDLYNKRYGQGYGSYIYNTEFEFADQVQSFELIFSPTVLVGYNGEDKVYSTIAKINSGTEEQIDSNIRILQTKKITGISSWTIKDGAAVIGTQTTYGYAGHLDDPDAPGNDLNFGALKELFFILSGGNLSNTQFNIYWSSYMAEITNKDSKLLSASFYLKPTDILGLDFSKYIHLEGVLFRLNKITDYNMSTPSDCKVELLKVNYTLY
jgi:hypothetical protein